MTYSSITCVKTFGFTIALGRPFSFLLLLLSKLLLGDEATLHVVPFVVVTPTTPPMQLSLTSATDVVVDVVNVELLVDVIDDDKLFTAVVDGVVVVVVVAVVSVLDFKSTFDVSSPD